MAMADSIWGTGRRLDKHLYQAGYEFEFFQAVRLLTLLQSESMSDVRLREPAETIRFGIDPSLSFPASSVVEIRDEGERQGPRISIAFMGLLGASGVLPLAYTEAALRRKSDGDASYAGFFDIFHHRLLSLFYCAWEKHHFAIGFERAQRDRRARDPLTEYLFDLIGMGTGSLQSRQRFPDSALLRYAGLLAQRPRSAECLRALLCDYFGIPVVIEQFLGRWHRLDADEQCMLGAAAHTTRLGEGTLAGDMIWSRQASIRVALGPMPAKRFLGFLPDGEKFHEAAALVRWFLGPTIHFEIQPVVAAGEVPHWCKLGERQNAGPMLGWCTWLGKDAFRQPAAQAIFGEYDGIHNPAAERIPQKEAYA